MSQQEYAEAVQHGKDFLAGKVSVVRERLRQEMWEASECLAFEKAARCRDAMLRLESLAKKEKESTGNLRNADVIVLLHPKSMAVATAPQTDMKQQLAESQVAQEAMAQGTQETESQVAQETMAQPLESQEALPQESQRTHPKQQETPQPGSPAPAPTQDHPATAAAIVAASVASLPLASQPCVYILLIRNGLYLGGDTFFLSKDTIYVSPEECIDIFLQQLYLDHRPPERVLLNCPPTSKSAMEEALLTRYNARTHIDIPKSGNGKKWISIALENAIEQSRYEAARSADFGENFRKLADFFALARVPKRIEVYDNSHLQGECPYGCFIVATRDGFDKKSYRRFSVSPRRDGSANARGGDDFAMMEEVMRRRFKQAGRDILPDLMFIDGGIGQISSVMRVLVEYGLSDIPVIGIAKGQDRNAGRERFFVAHEIFRHILDPFEPDERETGTAGAEAVAVGGVTTGAGAGTVGATGTRAAAGTVGATTTGAEAGAQTITMTPTVTLTPQDARGGISIPPNDPLLFFVQRLRDEAHRFAIGTHRSARERKFTQSQLSEIPGVGSLRKKLLLRKFGSVQRIKRASIDELRSVDGISAAIAKAIHDFFK
jgi:excinuclease ABC subunit C